MLFFIVKQVFFNIFLSFYLEHLEVTILVLKTE